MEDESAEETGPLLTWWVPTHSLKNKTLGQLSSPPYFLFLSRGLEEKKG